MVNNITIDGSMVKVNKFIFKKEDAFRENFIQKVDYLIYNLNQISMLKIILQIHDNYKYILNISLKKI